MVFVPKIFRPLLPVLIPILCIFQGCTIKSVPNKNILMFNLDGELVDPCTFPTNANSLGANNKCDEVKYFVWPEDYNELEEEGSDEEALSAFSGASSSPISGPNEKEIDASNTIQGHFRSIFNSMDEYFVGKDKKKILFFVHGGLNGRGGTIERAKNLYKKIKDEEDGYYPIFINWHSGLASSYWEHLVKIRQGEKSPIQAGLTAPFLFVGDLLRGIARGPQLWLSMALNEFQAKPSLRTFYRKLPPSLREFDQMQSIEAASQVLKELKNNPDNKLNFTLGGPVRIDCKELSNEDSIILNKLNDVENINDIKKDEWRYRHYDSESNDSAHPPGLICDHEQLEIGKNWWLFLTIPTRMIANPLIDSFGTSSWNNMLRRVNLLFHTDEEFHLKNDPSETRTNFVDLEPSGGLSLFMRELARKIQTDKKKERWEITLVGHSMGTIVLNEMIRNFGEMPMDTPENNNPQISAESSEELESLKENLIEFIQQPDHGLNKEEIKKFGGLVEKFQNKTFKMPFRNIVYMAAASSIRHFEYTVVPYLKKNHKTKFYNLMLHRTAELNEQNVWDIVPRGSLLVWIDDFLANPLDHQDRTLGRFDNFMFALPQFPKEIHSQIHIKAFREGKFLLDEYGEIKLEQGKPDPNPDPQEHGGFSSQFKFWNPHCWKPNFDQATEKCLRKDEN